MNDKKFREKRIILLKRRNRLMVEAGSMVCHNMSDIKARNELYKEIEDIKRRLEKALKLHLIRRNLYGDQ